MTCVPREDSDQTGHPVFAVCSLGSYGHADREDSDQTRRMPSHDMSLCLGHRSFCWFWHAVALSHILEFIDLL